MTPTLTAFKAAPDRGRGLARDMRVRWAFEEVGQPYEVRLVTFEQMKEPAHMALTPSARSRPMRRVTWRSSSPGPSSCTSPRLRRVCYPKTPRPGRRR